MQPEKAAGPRDKAGPADGQGLWNFHAVNRDFRIKPFQRCSVGLAGNVVTCITTLPETIQTTLVEEGC